MAPKSLMYLHSFEIPIKCILFKRMWQGQKIAERGLVYYIITIQFGVLCLTREQRESSVTVQVKKGKISNLI